MLTEPPTLIESFKGHNKPIRSLSFSCDETELATTSDDPTVLAWNLTPPIRAFKYIGHQQGVLSSIYTPQNLLVTSSADGTVRVWTPNIRGDSIFKKVHSKAVRSVDVSQDSRLIVTGSDDKTIKIFDSELNFRQSLQGHANWIRSAQVSKDERLVGSVSDDGTMRLWDLRSAEEVMCVSCENGLLQEAQKLKFSLDGTCAMICGFQDLQIWDMRASTLLQHYSCSSGLISDCCFGKGDKIGVAAAAEGLKLFDLERGRLIYTVKGHEGNCTACAISQDASVVCSGGTDGRVMLFEI